MQFDLLWLLNDLLFYLNRELPSTTLAKQQPNLVVLVFMAVVSYEQQSIVILSKGIFIQKQHSVLKFRVCKMSAVCFHSSQMVTRQTNFTGCG